MFLSPQFFTGIVPVRLSAGTTWNSADKSSNLTLSADKLTYTDGANSYAGVRTLVSLSGKMAWELTLTSISNPSGVTIGIGNATASLTSFLGSDSNSVGINGGGITFGPAVATVASWVSGDTLGMAVDVPHMTMWWRTIHSGTPGNWNNDASANPATNTNGVDISGLNAGPYYPMGLGLNSGDNATANFATPFLPSGFGIVQ